MTSLWAAESYLEVKHTPPEISVGNINTWGETLGQNGRNEFTDRSPVSHSSPRILSAVGIQSTMMTQLLPIVSAVFSVSRVRSDLYCARKEQREEMDRQGGRKKVWRMSDDASY